MVANKAIHRAVRIMPLGDSITAGYTDNPAWEHPFEFGYRSGLHKRMTAAGWDFVFVGGSPEPFCGKSGDPTLGGSVLPAYDLRTWKQANHRGYGGWKIPEIQAQVAGWITEDRPDLILLMIGINGIGANSPSQLEELVGTIFARDQAVGLILAQITPYTTYNQDLFSYNRFTRDSLVPSIANKGFRIATVDLYTPYLTDPDDHASIDPTWFSNGKNHPTNAMYGQIAERWFQAINTFLKSTK
jgi:lysophospholipase L1-like esterase